MTHEQIKLKEDVISAFTPISMSRDVTKEVAKLHYS
jgi:hypothetical protein